MARNGRARRVLNVAAISSMLVLAAWVPGAYAIDVPEPGELGDVTQPITDAVSDVTEPVVDAVSDVSEPVAEGAAGAVAPVDEIVGSASGSGSAAGALLGERTEGSTAESPGSTDPISGGSSDGRSTEPEATTTGGIPGPSSERRLSDPILHSSTRSVDEAATASAPSVDRCAGTVALCTLTFEVNDIGGLMGSVAAIVRYLALTGLMLLPLIAAALAFGLLGAVALVASQRRVAARPTS